MGTLLNNARRAILADRIFDGRRWHRRSAAVIEGQRLLGLMPRDSVPDDCLRHRLAAKSFLTPGFVDLQVNGGGGVLLNDQPTEEGMLAIARAHRRSGTTSFLPTLITDTREKTQRA